jgi:hypothetical protein
VSDDVTEELIHVFLPALFVPVQATTKERVFQDKMLSRKFESNRAKVTRGYKSLHSGVVR